MVSVGAVRTADHPGPERKDLHHVPAMQRRREVHDLRRLRIPRRMEVRQLPRQRRLQGLRRPRLAHPENLEHFMMYEDALLEKLVSRADDEDCEAPLPITIMVGGVIITGAILPGTNGSGST
ncbi:hypothetical protein SAZ11_16165 [Streptomyces sp. FXJ1.4098]|nr:hypothetical protein [Streptomyces sp. FXJ1.4098]